MKNRERYKVFCVDVKYIWSTIIGKAFAVVFVLITVSGYGQTGRGTAESPGAVNPFASFRDVPGVTVREIAAIEALQREHRSFCFGGSLTHETFLTENNEVGGFTALFCQWLTGLFGISFQPEIHTFNELLAGFNTWIIDFTGNLTVTEERLEIYFMTDPIAEHQLKMMRLCGSPSVVQITRQRLPRYAFLRNSISRDLVFTTVQPGTYEVVDVYNIDDAYHALLDGRADAFIELNTTVDGYPTADVYTEDFFPLISIPVSMATANPDLAPVISVVTKALRNGTKPHINYLYNLGYENYKKERFFSLLAAEERAYLQYSGPVPVVAGYSNYPVAFYNNRESRWEGIAFDVLVEVGKITGLTFTVVSNQNTEYTALLEMLYNGRVHIFLDLPYSEILDGRFLWARNNFMADQDVLSTFAFNIDQPVLRSIVDKAFLFINTDIIVKQWMTKTND